MNESPFQAIVRPQARISVGTRSHAGPPASAAVSSITATIPSPTSRSGTTRAPMQIRPTPAPDAERRGEHLPAGEHEGGGLLREAVLVDEKEHSEPDHGDLRIEVEPAAHREPPEPAVRDRPTDRRGLDPVLGLAAAQDDRARESAGRDERREKEERRLRASCVRDRRQRQRSDETSDRDRGLPDAEREAPLLRPEPVHDRTSARRVDGRTGGTDEAEQHDELREARGVRRADEEDRGAEHPDGEGDPLAEAVGGEAPREQRQRRPDPRRREEDADLAEREVVLLAKLRDDDRQADSERGVRRRRRRAGAEHRPPVPAPVYSPNGLIGRAPVETTTLFVSR